MLYMDVPSSMEGSKEVLVLTPLDGGKPLRYALTLIFKVTNNEA